MNTIHKEFHPLTSLLTPHHNRKTACGHPIRAYYEDIYIEPPPQTNLYHSYVIDVICCTTNNDLVTCLDCLKEMNDNI